MYALVVGSLSSCWGSLWTDFKQIAPLNVALSGQRWFSPVEWDQERSEVSRAHLGWVGARSLCVNLYGTTGSGKNTFLWQMREARSRTDVGGARTSEAGTWRSAQCTGWQRAGEPLPWWLTWSFCLRSRMLYFVPSPLMLVFRCAISTCFLFCFSFWAVLSE